VKVRENTWCNPEFETGSERQPHLRRHAHSMAFPYLRKRRRLQTLAAWTQICD